jgi:nucleoside-diphosphate-sugar epimerase
MESRILDAVRRGVIEGVVLRYGLFYGPDNAATLEQLAMVRRRRLPRVRGDEGLLPLIHLDDAVSATVAALERGVSGGVYDIVDDRPASFSDVVSEMARLTGAPRPHTVPGWLLRLTAPYLARLLTTKLQLSNTAARRELGWSPRYRSYREGLWETVDRLADAHIFC